MEEDLAAGSLYERALAARPAGAPSARPPRPSAAVVLWRRGAGGALEVFWVRRAETLAFMGGWHAFVGGALAREDAGLEVAGTARGLDPGTAAPAPEGLLDGLPELPPDLVPGLLAGALRELFEETGVLLARELPPEAAIPPGLAAARRRLVAGEAGMAEILAELGATLDASRLVYAGRWLTPPFGPLRFDNRFFLAEWPYGAAVQPEVEEGELAAGEWIEPAAALARWRRGEVMAAPPVLHLLRVLAEDGSERGLPRLLDPREANLGPCRRIEFRPGFLAFPMRTATLPPATATNAFLVGHGETVLIDPGSGDPVELDRLHRALAAALAAPGRRLAAIWLTHHHPDHVGGVEATRAAFGVPVLAHPATAERLAARGLRVDGTLEDGQEVTLAGEPPLTLRVVHTPGHARGHLCFFDAEGKTLLAGDLVAGVGTIVVDPPEGDMDDYLASLETALALAPATLLPAHGPAVHHGAAKLHEYLDHRLWREERVLAAWRAGLREPQAMLPTVYADVPPEAHPLAARQIEAHLTRLRRAGRLE
ncbi:MAG TPA: MBL fold metallo-hydrolase [Thermoanaerobaculia bacterium]|nr:MBL fold metallo-hydrolase [Thermoanaerobaculia bacterium]